jgi:hypothetical protein
MKRLKLPMTVIVTALILVGGFFLPSYISGMKDRQTMDRLSVIDSQAVSVEAKSTLSIAERLQLRVSAASVYLDNGKNMDSQTAYSQAVTELDKFSSLMGLDYKSDTFQLDNSHVEFLVDSADPSKNLVVWNIAVSNDDGCGFIASVDDETGKLLSIYYFTDKVSKYDLAPSASLTEVPSIDALATGIASYYGMKVVGDADYDKNEGKYVIHLSDGINDLDMSVALTQQVYLVNF